MSDPKETQKLNGQYLSSYLVYTRKSTDDAENQKNSMEYQLSEARKFATRENLAIAPLTIEGFCDAGIIKEHHSGFKQDENFVILPEGMIMQKVERPKFLQMASFLQKNQFKGIICLCWDRLSRNDGDDVIIKKLLACGADIRFVQATYDKSSSGALHMDIDGAFSRHYSRVIGEKVKNTVSKLRSEGRCTYHAPIGYLDNGSDSKPFDKIRAPIVKKIFEMYATGQWSYATLAQWANQQGLTTKPFRRSRSKLEKMVGVDVASIPKVSRPVTDKTIENILKNPFYIGKNRHGTEWIKSTAHQALINTSLFFQVQAMTINKTQSIHFPELLFYAYRGLIKCGGCGRGYSPYLQKGIVYYRSKCKAACSNPTKNITEDFITKKIQAVLDLVPFSPKELKQIEESASDQLKSVTDRRNTELEDLYKKHRKALDDLDYLAQEKLSLLRGKVMTQEQVIGEEVRLTKTIEEIQSRIDANAVSTKAMLHYIITFSELVQNNVSLYFAHSLDTEKHDIVTRVFSELKIYDEILYYKANKGFSALTDRFNGHFTLFGSPGRDRTCDQTINSRLLYR